MSELSDDSDVKQKAESAEGLPSIEAEGERIANATWRHPSGKYLWTDLVGAIQTAISEERARHLASQPQQSALAAVGWQPIETYDRERGEIVALLDWFTYRTDPAKKLNPVRYVGSWSDEYSAWFDDDGMDLDIDPTHWLPLPPVPEGRR